MPLDPQSFRSALVYDGARPNLFECRLNFPAVVSDANVRDSGADGLNVSRQFSFFCRSAQIPEQTVNMFPVYFQGREIKLAGNRTIPDWTVQIINDEDFKVRNAFELWNNAINGNRTNLRSFAFTNTNDYGADGFIIQYGKQGDILRTYKFVGLWPTNVGSMENDWGTNDVVQEYQVTFAVQWVESTVGDDNGTGSAPPLYNVEII